VPRIRPPSSRRTLLRKSRRVRSISRASRRRWTSCGAATSGRSWARCCSFSPSSVSSPGAAHRGSERHELSGSRPARRPGGRRSPPRCRFRPGAAGLPHAAAGRGGHDGRAAAANHRREPRSPVLLLARRAATPTIAALRRLGEGAELVTYPCEAHGCAARETLLDWVARMIEWYDRYVRNSGAPGRPAPARGCCRPTGSRLEEVAVPLRRFHAEAGSGTQRNRGARAHDRQNRDDGGGENGRADPH